jgi:hypothetical protein
MLRGTIQQLDVSNDHPMIFYRLDFRILSILHNDILLVELFTR